MHSCPVTYQRYAKVANISRERQGNALALFRIAVSKLSKPIYGNYLSKCSLLRSSKHLFGTNNLAPCLLI